MVSVKDMDGVFPVGAPLLAKAHSVVQRRSAVISLTTSASSLPKQHMEKRTVFVFFSDRLQPGTIR